MPSVDNLIRDQALHPLRTVHPEEWPEVRECLEKKLEKSVHTMVGVPLVLDHCQVLNGKVLVAESKKTENMIFSIARACIIFVWEHFAKNIINNIVFFLYFCLK
jgi:hypothetical protein